MTLTIKAKLLIVLGGLSATIAALAAAGWVGLALSNQALQAIHDDRVIPLKQLKVVSDRYAVNIVDTAHKVRSGKLLWAEGTKSVESAVTDIAAQWRDYTHSQLTADEARLVAEVGPVMAKADEAVGQLRRLFAAQDKAGLDAFVTDALYPAIDPVSDKIGEVVDLQLREASHEFAGAQEVTRISEGLQSALSAFGLSAVGFGIWIVIGAVCRPLGGMTMAMERLAGGDMSVKVPARDRRDEIGKMAAAVQVFKDGMKTANRLAAEQAAEQEQKATRQVALESSIKAFESSVSGVLKMVTSASTELQGTAQSMSSTADETQRQSAAVAAASQQASTNVQTVAAASEELAASIAEISRQVAESTQITGQAVRDVEKTNTQVRSLAEAATKIGEVVSLINDVAAQTNLLALNATIEAARAGDAGKGFAVVASEVKQLATQTARATGEISGQIKAIQDATMDAVTAIAQIGQTIGRVSEIAVTIASAVEQQGAATQEIARNVSQAASGTNEVSANIENVTRAANETGSAAAQVLSASNELSKQSEVLNRQVDGFIQQVRVA